ncbi:hypothetical protein [Hyphococcus sp.]|uniref:hypothetical protein n=1 Tax=Hyphococcus sp. TaxID=2038636 RepID=UPI003CCBE133
MTEYEAADLFFTIHQSAVATLSIYITVIFAMLVAGYLVAHRLDRITAGVLVGVFAAFSLGMINEVRGVYSDLAGVAQLINEKAIAPNSELNWHGAAGNPDFFATVPKILSSITILVFIGTLVFFFRLRWARLKKQGNIRPSIGDI